MATRKLDSSAKQQKPLGLGGKKKEKERGPRPKEAQDLSQSELDFFVTLGMDNISEFLSALHGGLNQRFPGRVSLHISARQLPP